MTILLEAFERSPTESSPVPTLCVFCLDDIDIVSASGFLQPASISLHFPPLVAATSNWMLLLLTKSRAALD